MKFRVGVRRSYSSCGNPQAAWPLRFSVWAALSFTILPVYCQTLIKPPFPGEPVTLIPSDMAALESPEARTDLPCTVTPRKTELGFDLRFHGGYDITIPLNELQGSGEVLTIVFRVIPEGDKDHPAYFSQHITVPVIQDDARGEVLLQGAYDLGLGHYHVDWMMRDRQERPCSSSWDTEAALSQKDGAFTLFIAPKSIAEAQYQPFRDEPVIRAATNEPVNVKLLVNFSPESKAAAALGPADVSAMVGILRIIEHDPHVGKVSVVAFSMHERRIVYRQDPAAQINFQALGNALQTMKLGTVTVGNLGDKHGDTDFLGSLIEKEVGGSGRPDAVIFAGPKAMLDADVPPENIRRIGEIECPVFYMNYNPNPQADPWKDSISHAVRTMRGTEYTISRPRDLWYATSEMMSRVVRSKHIRADNTAASSGSK